MILSIADDTGRSKKIQFSLLNSQDTVKLAEFEVTHRDLYTAIDRLPVKNGVLDRRLVRFVVKQESTRFLLSVHREPPRRTRFVRHAVSRL